MSVFDIIVLTVFIIAVLHGAMTGVFRQLGVIGGVVMALLFTGLVSSGISELAYILSSGSINLEGTLYYTIIFSAIVIITFIASIFLYQTTKSLKIGWLDCLLGAVFGGVKMLLISGILLNVYVGLYKHSHKTEPPPIESLSYTPLLESVSVIVNYAGEFGITFEHEKE